MPGIVRAFRTDHPMHLAYPQPAWRSMAPDPRLRPYVRSYYLELPPAVDHVVEPPSSGDTESASGEELLIPDGHSELVFIIDSAFERWTVGRPERRALMRESYVIGSRSQSVVTRDVGPVAVAGIKLDPRALRHLIGTPLLALRDSTVGLRELGQFSLLELEEAVASAASPASGAPDRVARAFDRVLLQALRAVPSRGTSVDALLAEIQATRGSMSIMRWTEQHGLDTRQLERQFAAAIGMTPKRYARIIRFKFSYHRLIDGAKHGPGAHLDGFYDQSHFNKEFKAFIGAPPTARLARALRYGTGISDRLLADELSASSAASARP